MLSRFKSEKKKNRKIIIVVEYLAREIKHRTDCDIGISLSPSNGVSDSRSCGSNKGVRRSLLPLCGNMLVYLLNCF